jgi:plastocyanin
MNYKATRIRAVFLALVAFAIFGSGTVLAHEGRDVGDHNFVVGFINEPAIEGMINGVSIRVTGSKADDHNHMDNGAGDAMAMDSEIDLVSHGGVFVSELAAGGQYQFKFGHEFEDLTVPFHAHPNEIAGSIMVGHDNPAADMVMVEIHSNGFSPNMVMIQPGTTVMFMNTLTDTTVVMSGPLGEVEPVEQSHSGDRTPISGLLDLQVEVTHIASEVSQVMTLKEAFGDAGHYKAEFIPTSPGPYRFRFFGDVEGTQINETFESSNTTFDEVTPASDVQFPVQLAAPRETENAARGALDAATLAGQDANDASNAASTATILGIIAVVLGLGGLVLGGLAFQRLGSKGS